VLDLKPGAHSNKTRKVEMWACSAHETNTSGPDPTDDVRTDHAGNEYVIHTNCFVFNRVNAATRAFAVSGP
jgi:hypothetical protein